MAYARRFVVSIRECRSGGTVAFTPAHGKTGSRLSTRPTYRPVRVTGQQGIARRAQRYFLRGCRECFTSAFMR